MKKSVFLIPIGAWLGASLAFAAPAAAQEETRIEFASITFTAVTFESKNAPKMRTRSVANVPYEQCETMASALATDLQSAEAESAQAVNRNNWRPISGATCVKSFKLVPAVSFTVATFCQMDFDPDQVSILAQEGAECSG